MIEVTEETFADEVLSSPGLTLVDYWAEWCAPCRMVTPVLEEIAGEYTQLKVVKVNVDEQPMLASGITSIPTLRLYRSGDVVTTIIGAQPKRRLLNELAPYLRKGI